VQILLDLDPWPEQDEFQKARKEFHVHTYTYAHTHTRKFCRLIYHSYNSFWSDCGNRSAVFQGLFIYNIHAHTLYFCTCSSSCNFEQGIRCCFTNIVQNNMSTATLTETNMWLSLNIGWRLRCRKIITCTLTSSSSEIETISYLHRHKPYNTPPFSDSPSHHNASWPVMGDSLTFRGRRKPCVATVICIHK
jgi:hypothetical protein